MKINWITALVSIISLPTLAVFFFIGVSQATAQTPSSPVNQPNFFPLAPCPSCAAPSEEVMEPDDKEKQYDKKEKSGEEKPGNEQPDEEEQPDMEEPCEAEGASIAHDKKKKDSKHRNNKGDISGFMEQILNFLLELISKLIELLGGQPIKNPENPAVPDGEPAEPCEPTDEEPAEPVEPEEPGVSTSPLPSTTVPGTSTAPLPSTIVPSTVVPSGTAVTGCTQADIQKLVNSVSQANIEANLKKLVQDDSKPTPNELISRHVSSPGNKVKVDWATQQMTSYGLQIVSQPFTSGGRNLNNVVARVNGSDPNSLYAVGAHIDAISENPSVLAPGADDDGSGVVVAMEAGRVLKGFERCLKSSIDFIAFNDEEEELNGSPTYVESLSGKTFKGAYNMDMIGYAPSGACLKSDVKEAARDQAMAQKIVDMNTKYSIGMNVTTGRYTQNEGDDLAAFWNANHPGAYLIECATEDDPDLYPDYHKTTDNTKNVDFAQLTQVAKLLVAALAELASQ